SPLTAVEVPSLKICPARLRFLKTSFSNPADLTPCVLLQLEQSDVTALHSYTRVLPNIMVQSDLKMRVPLTRSRDLRCVAVQSEELWSQATTRTLQLHIRSE